ncbi:electron transport complex protein, subunit C [Gottschalkia acidurici 9a]|uniref:Ion-translocating oxidoreductase complex subunit C n=1 Tax=Gottschalkia acidurici (strain ATCC 7906 / DSM 604 / BCRC 14475 / CIP 104303 / KCTC 5404 / NCIMB 10678 / 9a) TaxID=1128398 RepID=K0B036_GOTA9|nr:electron transport complex subunit RsxC [Gottschalkia acidurici]AFS78011.1 electron transport complex protein, subunit C [Gottschalkia acidurici 9a]
MGLKSFKGGIHPEYSKSFTEKVALEKAKEPKMVTLPLQQHIGAPCEPIVKVGDSVKIGQKIGEASGFVSAAVHSSISGTVKKIAEVDTPNGKILSVIIESDGTDAVHESVKPKGSLDKLTKDEIVNIIKEAGITGLGGASFPTHVKLSPPPEKKVDTVVLNGAECEPFLTADHRLMLEQPEKVIFGLKAIMKAVGVTKGSIGVEDNKKDAIEALKKAAANEPNIEIVELETKYPQGDEKRLIDATTGRKVPVGGLPMDVGVVVNNVGTAAAVATAIQTGMPLIERIVTITGGAINTPKNLIVKLGTPFKEVIEQCGGYKGTPGKIIMGGPMMGGAQFTDEVPVIKGTSGILVLSEEQAKIPEAQQCIRCGKCVEVCPVNLQPVSIRQLSVKERHEETEKLNVLSCIECGSCSFICPAKIPLLQSIKVSKQDLLARKRKSK